MEPSTVDVHDRHRKIWQQRTVLRQIYEEWFRWIASARTKIPGITLEVGSGIGALKSFLPDIYSSDISFCPWLDLNLEATRLPFKDASLSNLIGFDILHHLSEPLALFSEAERCLKTHGRLILIEPYLTPLSRLIWKFHPESIDFKVDLFGQNEKKSFISKSPYAANQAIPFLLFKKNLDKFSTAFPQLKLLTRKPFSYLAYPLSGGFDKKQILPSFVFSFLTKLEYRLDFLREWCAFRIFVVLERN